MDDLAFRLRLDRARPLPLAARNASGLPLALGDSVLGQRASVALILKRLMDIAIAAGALLVLLPLFGFVALAIKTSSPGPVFFRQWREGRDGTTFEILKFRTMDSSKGDRTGIAQTIDRDERVTRLGALLRKTSIDELPQLLNVLKGDMSLVGPRPHVAGMLAAGQRYDELVAYYQRRRCMRPGLTGWAQANGLRGPTTDARRAIARIEHDVAYIQNYSLLLDLQIILATLKREFLSGSGN